MKIVPEINDRCTLVGKDKLLSLLVRKLERKMPNYRKTKPGEITFIKTPAA